jgi:CHAT domain-containing protein
LISVKESIQQISLNLTIRYEYASSLALIKKQPTRTEIDYAGFAPEYTDQEYILQRGLDSFITHPVYSANRSSIGNLLFNGPEIKEAAGILQGEVYQGNSVNKEVFVKNSTRARILHLAMHAQTDDKHPEYSQLVFKNEQDPAVSEAMYAYEVARMKLNADLSVLSACNTGSGKYQKGEGVLSLARAFKASGCPNIVMSLWPANDASTKDIVVGFFKHLKAGMGKADALRQSKQDYLGNATEELKHPYYWAGLVLIGDNEPMKFDSSQNLFILLLGISAFVALLVYRWVKPRKL